MRFLYGHSMQAGDVPAFRRTLRGLRQSFEFISVVDAVEAVWSRRRDGRYVCFSFDDGFRDNHDLIAPLLVEAGATACFFVSTGLIRSAGAVQEEFLRERFRAAGDLQPMSWEMVAALSRAGFDIGSHTVDHFNLATLDEQEALRQALSAKSDIESRIGVPCRWFAWPIGKSSDCPATVVQRLTPRFEGIFTAIRSPEAVSSGGLVINRDHFEPGWPRSHVRYFRASPVHERAAVGCEIARSFGDAPRSAAFRSARDSYILPGQSIRSRSSAG